MNENAIEKQRRETEGEGSTRMKDQRKDVSSSDSDLRSNTEDMDLKPEDQTEDQATSTGEKMSQGE